MNPFIQLLFNPAIISLLAGIVFSFVSRFTMPSWMVNSISIYLIFTIGFKGGACLGVANECTPPLLMLAALGLVIGFMQPFVHYFILKRTTDLDTDTAAVVAAEYGSISIITFITAISFLTERAIAYDTFMTAVAGMMEIPAIFSGLWIIKSAQKESKKSGLASFFDIVRAIVTCKKISFIFIGFFVGFLLRNYEVSVLKSFIKGPFFELMLVLFMFDVGIKIGKQKSSFSLFSPSLLAFGLYVPLVNGCLGVVIAHLMGANLGTLILFAVLIASASYIAVPAIMSTQTKKAKQAIYLPLSLGVTLPFNILIGIPLYYYLGLFIQGL